MKQVLRNILRVFYISIVGALLIPLVQYKFNVLNEEPLSGEYKKQNVELPVLSLNNLRNGSFQSSMDRFWQNELGCRNWLIRINNQLNYSVFDQANANGTIVCGENVLITEGDIKSYLGSDFVGKEKMDEMLDKAKFISDSLRKNGIPFVFMVAPSKASVYKDQIPSKYFSMYNSGITNYDYFVKGVSERNIRIFDAKKIILEDESYFDYPVFPKNGVHWSGNTVAKITDTLMEYLSTELRLNVPSIELGKGEETILNYRYTDYDIGEAMNLLWNISDDVLHYPTVKFVNSRQTKPNLLGVGDSFIQSFYGFYPVLDSVFSQHSNLWYYHKTVGWPDRLKKYHIKTQELDLGLELQKRDLVIVEMTEENLKMTGYDFIDEVYDHFTGKNIVNAEKQPLYDKLSADPEINKRATEIAPVLGYTIPQMKDALIMNKVKNEWLINFDYEAEVQRIMVAIKSTPKWYGQIKEKAIRRNESVEKTLRDDAIWVVNKNLGN